MSHLDFVTRQTQDLAYIEQVINNCLPLEECLQKKIFEAVEYSLLAGGKRLRPMLMLLTYRLFGGENNEIIEPFMAAIEMIHTYSLVHDDLPAMDNDEFRRGRKTTHIVYGEALGILTGDALLNYAFETASKTFEHTEHLNRTGRALWVLSKKAGIFGMIGGQVIDMEGFDNQTVESLSENIKNTRQDATREEIITEIKNRLDYLYSLKTGALLEASMMIGAILAGADDVQVNIIEKIAAQIGIAFQIQDDILDVTSTTEELGKPVHSDDKNKKITYASLMGIENAAGEVKRHSELAKQLLLDMNKESGYLIDLIDSLISRRK